MSTNDVHRLWREGLSVRQIAARLGLQRMKVHRWLTAGPEWDGDGNGDGLALGDEQRLTPPFTFVGMDPPHGGMRAYARYVDANGRSWNPLDLYRWQHHFAPYETSGRVYAEVMADLDRQIAEAGWVRVDIHDGYWQWEQADAPGLVPTENGYWHREL